MMVVTRTTHRFRSRRFYTLATTFTFFFSVIVSTVQTVVVIACNNNNNNNMSSGRVLIFAITATTIILPTSSSLSKKQQLLLANLEQETTKRFHRLEQQQQQQIPLSSTVSVVAPHHRSHPSIRRKAKFYDSSSSSSHEKKSSSSSNYYSSSSQLIHNSNMNAQEQQLSTPFVLTDEQYKQCTSAMIYSDSNSDNQLDQSEYLSFLTYSATKYYGYDDGFGYDLSGQIYDMDDLPLEFVMLFHSTACLCAYDVVVNHHDTTNPVTRSRNNRWNESARDESEEKHNDDDDDDTVENSITNTNNPTHGNSLGCCMGNLGQIHIYESMGLFANDITEEQEAYTRLFCTEAYYYLDLLLDDGKMTTYAPTTLAPSTESPTMESSTSMAPISMAPTSMAPTLAPSNVIVTDAPTASVAAPPTNEPTIMEVVATFSPTIADTTYEPTSSLTTVEPTMKTLAPTVSREIETAPPVAPPVIPTPTVIEIEIQYGITSDCGVTAEDVLSGNDGITIQDGLIVATETLLIEILNTTYPSGEIVPTVAPSSALLDDGTGTTTTTFSPTDELVTSVPTSTTVSVGVTTATPTAAKLESTTSTPSTVADTGDGTATPTVTSSTASSSGVTTPSPSAAVTDATSSTPTVAVSLETRNVNIIHSKILKARVRVNHLDRSPLRRRLSIMEDESSLFRLHNSRSRQRLPPELYYHQRQSQSAVYYTEENPVVINDITDVTDDTCPSELTCMKVESTLYVTLEEGIDAEEVEIQSVIKNGFEASFQDFSFFNAIPDDTVYCPSIPTSSPTAGVTTLAPSVPKEIITTSAPTTYQWPTISPTLASVETSSSPSLASSGGSPIATSLSPSSTGSIGTDTNTATSIPSAGGSVRGSAPSTSLTTPSPSTAGSTTTSSQVTPGPSIGSSVGLSSVTTSSPSIGGSSTTTSSNSAVTSSPSSVGGSAAVASTNPPTAISSSGATTGATSDPTIALSAAP